MLPDSWWEISHILQSVSIFERVRELEPYRTQGLDTYATALYKLHRGVKLSEIGNELLEIDPGSPIPWVFHGRSFGLRGDHLKAIEALERATQLQPTFAHAHVLAGDEHGHLKEWEVALACYRRALQNDPDSDQAWYVLA